MNSTEQRESQQRGSRTTGLFTIRAKRFLPCARFFVCTLPSRKLRGLWRRVTLWLSAHFAEVRGTSSTAVPFRDLSGMLGETESNEPASLFSALRPTRCDSLLSIARWTRIVGIVLVFLALLDLSVDLSEPEQGELQKAAPNLLFLGISLAVTAISSLVLASRTADPEKVAVDDRQTTLSTRGSFTNYVSGRREIQPVFCFAGARETRRIRRGGKGYTGGGQPVEQVIRLEAGWHLLGLGPMSKIHAIRENGKALWTGEVERPIDGAPVSITTTAGDCIIYWGTQDQEVNVDLSNATGIESNWPYLAYAWWYKKELLSSNTWGTIEYECTFVPELSQLVSSSSFLEEDVSLSSESYRIKDTRNGTAGTNYIVVPNDERTTFLIGNQARIANQPTTNGDFFVLDTQFDEIVGIVSFPGVSYQKWDPSTTFRSGTHSHPSGLTVKDLAGPQNGGVYIEADKFLRRSLPLQEQYFTCSIRPKDDPLNPGQYIAVDITAEFWNVEDAARRASVEISFNTGGSFTHSSYGVTDYSVTTQGDAWVQVLVRVKTGDGVSLAESDDRRWMSLRFHTPSGGEAHVTEHVLRETNGTKVSFTETLANLQDFKGDLIPYIYDAFEGVNAAHLLDQFLHAPSPHGVELPRGDYFDVDSLEDLGVLIETEDLRTNVVFKGGVTLEDALESILLDLGIAIPSDPITGLLRFLPVRDPSGSVISVPEEMVVSYPEIEALQDNPTADRIVYSFADRTRGYRETTLLFNNDGTTSLEKRANVKTIALTIATDLIEASKIAERRRLEDLVRQTKVRLVLNREGRLLLPGQVISVPSVLDENLRILSVSPSVDSPNTTVECIIDVFGIPQPGVDFDFGGAPSSSGSSAPVADPRVYIWELPRIIISEENKVAILRTRATLQTTDAGLWFSGTGSIYSFVGSHTSACLSGELLEEIPLGSLLVSGDVAEVDFDGPPDFFLVDDYSGDPDNWYGGRQICLFVNPSGEEEICFLEALTLTGVASAYLKGLIRGRWGTSRIDLPVGSQVFVFPASTVQLFSDPLVSPGSDLYVKTQPRTSTSISIDSVTPQVQTLEGRWVRPIAPGALRMADGIPSYSTGEDLLLAWNFRSSGGYAYRTGAGYQRYGEACGSHGPDGDFQLIVTDPAQPSLSLVKLVPPSFGTTIYNVEIVSTFGGEPSQLDFELRGIQSGRTSDPATLSIELL